MELCRFLEWIPLAEELFASLVPKERSTDDAAWFLELSRRVLETTELERARRIISLANDVGELIAAEAVADRVEVSSPTYRRDLRLALGFQ